MLPTPAQRASAPAWPTLASLLAFACSAPPQPAEPAAPTPLPAAAQRDFAAALGRYFTGQFPADEPGGAVLIMKHDRVVFAHGYGLADLKTREPATLADARTIKTFPNWTSPTPPEIGWSWFHKQYSGYPLAIGHTGHQGGFAASYFTLPDKAIHWVILCGSPRDIDAFALEILQQLERARWLD